MEGEGEGMRGGGGERKKWREGEGGERSREKGEREREGGENI